MASASEVEIFEHLDDSDHSLHSEVISEVYFSRPDAETRCAVQAHVDARYAAIASHL